MLKLKILFWLSTGFCPALDYSSLECCCLLLICLWAVDFCGQSLFWSWFDWLASRHWQTSSFTFWLLPRWNGRFYWWVTHFVSCSTFICLWTQCCASKLLSCWKATQWDALQFRSTIETWSLAGSAGSHTNHGSMLSYCNGLLIDLMGLRLLV